MNQLELENAVVAMVERRGRPVMDRTKQEILGANYDNGGVIDSALLHYTKVNLPLVFPLFPALMSLSYEAAVADGLGEDVFSSVAVAMVLIAFSADIHDDIIDRSAVKYAKKTIYGKFGSEIALLAGDALFIHGYSLLHQACEFFSLKQKRAIFGTLSRALFELCSAEALEIELNKKAVMDPEGYFEVMRLRGVFAELQCRVGGIIGQADDELLAGLASFGRTVGMFGTIKDEFNDLFDVSELLHRLKFEGPPLPMVYAFQDERLGAVINELVGQMGCSKLAVKKIAKLVLGSEGVCMLKRKLGEKLCLEFGNKKLYEGSRVSPEVSLLLELLSFDLC